MNKKLVLITTLVTLAIFTTVIGCKRGDNTVYNDVTFWNNESIGEIDVTIDNSVTDVITAERSASTCNVNGCANFVVSAGTHNFRAVSTDGYEWDGTFYSDRICNVYELNTDDANYHDVSFWNNKQGVGPITVTVDGNLADVITAIKNPANCNESGVANFSLLRLGNHTFTAVATTGETWSGNFTVNSGCLLFQLK